MSIRFDDEDRAAPDGLDAGRPTVVPLARPVAADGPLPLFPDLPPAEPYPLASLGPVLGNAAAAIARKVQVPEAAQAVLAAASLAAQALADVTMPYGQTRPLSLFFVTVAASGDRKSTCDNEALWPVAKREKALREEHGEAMKVWRIEHGAWTAERKKIEGNGRLDFPARKNVLGSLGSEPAKPLAPFLHTGDLTVEGLAKVWPDAHPALGIFTAEAGIFIGGHGMNDDNRLKTAGMLSELWGGEPIKRLRALDGVTILPGRRLAMHLMVQPDAAAGFLGNAVLRDQGLLSRVLVAAPQSLAGARFHREVEPADDAAIRAYRARMLALLEAPLPLADGRNELAPRALTIQPDATALLTAFADRIEGQCGSADGLKPIGDFAAKAAEHAARMAGVLTIVGDAHSSTIGREAMASAIRLADWYVAETSRLHQAGRRDPKLVTANTLLEWLRGQGGRPIRFREDVLQAGPSALRTKAAAEAALVTLADHGWVEEVSKRPRVFRLAKGASP